MTGRLLDIHAITAFLARVAPLSGDALHEAFVCASLEGGGRFHVPAEDRSVLTLYRISASGPTEAEAIAAWITRARKAVADTAAEADALPASP
ncbi:hypothetical protein PSM7751_04123 [Pseudooceanicola marinus]|uniref:Uncharacterized protein n=1 Tax=Pseudooceanicola marinus TaxID=396013 RepID=A0A1X7AAM7_9RHOB|nr:hypothetical protein [Pseudooceanicola marinus]PJE26559.1 hypothetical protein CVM50_19035 [Pseudooceanicola marinus]SLN74178.1 hypothetical protein PSM7751_04123 [Pseudooceanicola marinus]